MGCENSHLYRDHTKLLSQEVICNHIAEGRLQYAEAAADDLFLEEKFEQAINCYQKIIEVDLNADYEAIGLGNLQMLDGMLPASKYEMYQRTIEQKLVKKNPYDALSLCYASLPDSNRYLKMRGLQWYESQIQKAQNYQIYMGYANLLCNSHCFDEAITNYKRAISLKPTITTAYIAIIFIRHYFRYNRTQLAQMMLKLQKIDSSNIYYRFLNLIQQPSTEKQKLKALDALYKQFPNFVRIKNEMGIYFTRLALPQQAIKEYKICIEYHHSYATAYFNLANCLESSNKCDQAITMYLMACYYRPAFHQAYSQLARIFNKINSTDEQIKAYSEKCVGLSQSSFQYYLGVGYAEAGELKKAMKWYQSAIKMDKSSFEVYNSIGILQEDIQLFKNEDQCLSSYHESLKHNPFNEIAYYNMAIHYKEQKMTHKSKECYEKALQIDPRFCEALNNLGNLKKDQQEYTQAIECYRKVIKYDSNYVLAYANLIICQQAMKSTKRALTTYLKAKEQPEEQWRGRLHEKSQTFVKQSLRRFGEEMSNLQRKKFEPIYAEFPSSFTNEDDHSRLNYRHHQLASLQTRAPSSHYK